jgi:hypothetical protein
MATTGVLLIDDSQTDIDDKQLELKITFDY